MGDGNGKDKLPGPAPGYMWLDEITKIEPWPHGGFKVKLIEDVEPVAYGNYTSTTSTAWQYSQPFSGVYVQFDLATSARIDKARGSMSVKEFVQAAVEDALFWPEGEAPA